MPVLTMNIIDQVRMENAESDCRRVQQAGWKLAHYESPRGHHFIAARGEQRVYGPKRLVKNLAFVGILRMVLERDKSPQ